MRQILLLIGVVTALARGDVVECQNGDRYNGTVLAVDATTVKVQNDITGILTIPRAKVSTITFGTSKSSKAIAAAPPRTNTLSRPQPFQFDAAAVAQVQNQLLGDANPETAQMFQEMIGGLMSGKLDLRDIQSKAQGTLNDLKSLQKELGDDDSTALLANYASILENFLKQSQAPTNRSPASVPQPSPGE